MKISKQIIRSALITPFFILVILLVVGMVQTIAGCTDVAAARVAPNTNYHNHAADLTADIAQAKADWIAENGEWQPNLTAEQEKEVRLMVVKMQSEAQQ